MTTSSGWTLNADSVEAATDRSRIAAQDGVQAQAPFGTLTAQRMELAPGEASVSCELDYAREGDGAPLLEFDRDAIADALGECAERGVVRLRYAGKINAARCGFKTILFSPAWWAASGAGCGTIRRTRPDRRWGPRKAFARSQPPRCAPFTPPFSGPIGP